MGKILDLTESDLVNLRRTLYLTIMSSVSFEECAHKITRLKIPDGYELELCNMLGELEYFQMLTDRSENSVIVCNVSSSASLWPTTNCFFTSCMSWQTCARV